MLKKVLSLSLATLLLTPTLVINPFNLETAQAQRVYNTNRSRKYRTNYNRSGVASWYGGHHHGRRTASGRVFNKYALTAAHNGLPFGTRVRVTNQRTGRSVIVVITDTGGFNRYNREIDLSQGAFQRIAPLGQGLARVSLQVL